MKEKRKSTPNAKVLTVLLIVLFLGSCAALVFAIVTGNLSRDRANAKATEPSETVAVTESATAESTKEVLTTTASESTAASTEKASASLELDSSYAAKSAVDLQGNDVNLSMYFGSGFASYGGEVQFDGENFAIYMGVSSGSMKGTYEFLSESEIQLTFENSDVSVAKCVSENGKVVSLDIPIYDIVVTFS